MSFKTVIFTAVLLQYGACNLKTVETGVLPKSINNGKIPDYFDWRESDMVSPVKDQQQCNVCWAFSIIANIESHLRIYLHQDEILSEQFLLDCTPNNGCNDVINVLKMFSYIVTELGGVLRERDYYKYDPRKNRCRWRQDALRNQTTGNEIQKDITPIMQVSKYGYDTLIPVIGFRRVKRDEDLMAYFVYHYGPITAGINSKSMDNYSNGIDQPTDDQCDPEHLDHNVLIVGYSAYVDKHTGKVTPYWIIKNSWGRNWGDDGYYYLERGRNACGIANDVSFAFVN